MTTKSGTNALHGAAYDYYRDEKFDSNTYFNDQFRTERGLAPLPKFVNDQNQFGANLGGPIVKDKAFFFADYEGTRITRGVTRITQTPTLANRQGVFTTAIRDPLTGQPFPGNVIPPSRIDPVARAIFDLLPQPNTPGANNYTRSDAQLTDDADRFLGRVDLQLTNSDNIFARYIYTTRKRVLPGWFGGIIDGTSSSALGDQSMKSNSLVAGWTRIIGPTLVNEFRFSLSKADSDLVQVPFGQDPPPAAVVPGVPEDPLFSGGVTGMNHRRLLRRRRQDRLPQLLAQVPAHGAVGVPEHAVLAQGQPPVQVRRQRARPHEERVHGRSRHAGRPELPRDLHRQRGGGLPARLRLGLAAHHALRRGPAALGDLVLRPGRLEGRPTGSP